MGLNGEYFGDYREIWEEIESRDVEIESRDVEIESRDEELVGGFGMYGELSKGVGFQDVED